MTISDLLITKTAGGMSVVAELHLIMSDFRQMKPAGGALKAEKVNFEANGLIPNENGWWCVRAAESTSITQDWLKMKMAGGMSRAEK